MSSMKKIILSVIIAHNCIPSTGYTRDIIDIARDYWGLTDWEPRERFFSNNKSTFCNVFVGEVIEEAGKKTWAPIRRTGTWLDRTWEYPVAKEWADHRYEIKGWKVVFHSGMANQFKSAQDILELRKPGDVVSGGGHMGIVSDDPRGSSPPRYAIFSASSLPKAQGRVVLNHWSTYDAGVEELFNTPIVSNPGNLIDRELQWIAKFTVRRYEGNID